MTEKPGAAGPSVSGRDRLRARAPRLVGSTLLFYIVAFALQLRRHSTGVALLAALIATVVFIIVLVVVVGGLVLLMKKTRPPGDGVG